MAENAGFAHSRRPRTGIPVPVNNEADLGGVAKWFWAFVSLVVALVIIVQVPGAVGPLTSVLTGMAGMLCWAAGTICASSWRRDFHSASAFFLVSYCLLAFSGMTASSTFWPLIAFVLSGVMLVASFRQLKWVRLTP